MGQKQIEQIIITALTVILGLITMQLNNGIWFTLIAMFIFNLVCDLRRQSHQ